MIQGTGIDIIEIEKLEKIIKRSGERFIRRVFTKSEIIYCNKKRWKYQHFAVRFAAKEALFKAFGTGWQKGFRWIDVETLNDEGGRPRINLFGKVGELARRMKIKKIHISLAHSGNYVVAQVILEK